MAEDHITLQEALELVRQLDSDDRLRLRDALDQITECSTEEQPEMSFKRVLLEKGMISEIRSPRKIGCATIEHRRPVPVKGKPVSETIIEDRG